MDIEEDNEYSDGPQGTAAGERIEDKAVTEVIGEDEEDGELIGKSVEAMLQGFQKKRRRLGERLEQKESNPLDGERERQPAGSTSQAHGSAGERVTEQETSGDDHIESMNPDDRQRHLVGLVNMDDVEKGATETDLKKTLSRLERRDPFLLKIE